MSLASGRRCMRPGETRSRRSCRSKTRRRRHRLLRGLRPQVLPRSADLSLLRNLQAPTPDPAVAAGPTPTASAPVLPPASAAPVAGSKAEKVASLPPLASAPAVVTSVAAAPAQGAQDCGLDEAAKMKSRLGELEAALKERSNATVTRADVDKAETRTSPDQISRLAAIVTRLTGQVKDLEDQVRTVSAGAQEKLADLTRRVSMSKSKSAVTAAERANVSRAASEGSAATASAGVEGQAQGVRMKIAGVGQKRNYRIQAASPGLAMLKNWPVEIEADGRWRAPMVGRGDPWRFRAGRLRPSIDVPPLRVRSLDRRCEGAEGHPLFFGS